MDVQHLFSKSIVVAIFLLKFAIGFNTAPRHFTYFWHRLGLLLRSLFSVLILVPLIAITLVELLELPFGVSVTLLLLSAAPDAPLTPYKAYKAVENYAYGLSLQLWLVVIGRRVGRSGF